MSKCPQDLDYVPGSDDSSSTLSEEYPVLSISSTVPIQGK